MTSFLYAGSSIYACHATGRHIVALEAEKSIYDALLAPLTRRASNTVTQPEHTPTPPIDLDEEEVLVCHVVRTSKFSK